MAMQSPQAVHKSVFTRGMAMGMRGAKRIADGAQASRHRSQAMLCRVRHSELILRKTPDDGADASLQRAFRNARRCGLLTVTAARSRSNRARWTVNHVPDPHHKTVCTDEQKCQERCKHRCKKHKRAKLTAAGRAKSRLWNTHEGSSLNHSRRTTIQNDSKNATNSSKPNGHENLHD